MKIAFLKPPEKGSFRGVNFYAERLLAGLHNISGLEVNVKPYNPFATYTAFDLVHSPFFEPYFFSLPVLASPPVVVTIHDATRLVFPDKFPVGPKGKTIWKLQKALLNKVDYVITDSQTSKKDIVRLYPWTENKITSIYLAADDDFHPLTDQSKLKQLAKKYQLPEKFLLYVGGANWNKNVITLCRAVEHLNVALAIVGKEWLNQNIDQTNIETEPLREVLSFTKGKSNFIFPGFVPTENLAGIYNLATGYVQPSIYEGFGLPVLEAMRCGLPVICGQNSSLSEIAGLAAIYADVTSPSSLAQKISEVLKLPNSSRETIQKQSLIQAAKFSWENTAKETYAIYQKVLGQH